MKRIAVFIGLFLAILGTGAYAQSYVRAQAQAVATCGGQSLTAGVYYPVTQDLTGTLCTPGGSTVVTGTVTALANETNPTSTLTSGTATSLTLTNNFIASSTTAGSIVVPSYAMTTVSGGNALNRRWRLTTNATSGWGATLTVNFWKAAPTYTNGDGAAYAVATGGAGYLGTCSITLVQFGDAASGVCAPTTGSEIGFVATGQMVYWDLQATGTLTKTSGQTFTITAEVLDNK